MLLSIPEGKISQNRKIFEIIFFLIVEGCPDTRGNFGPQRQETGLVSKEQQGPTADIRLVPLLTGKSLSLLTFIVAYNLISMMYGVRMLVEN